jgi:voltage-gated potassium channel Kch
MLAAGTMISVKKRKIEETLGLMDESRIRNEEDDDLDIFDIPVPTSFRRASLFNSGQDTIQAALRHVASGDFTAKEPQGAWRINKVLMKLDKTVEGETTIVVARLLRDKVYFAFQGAPSRLMLPEPWPAVSMGVMVTMVVVIVISCLVLAIQTVAQVMAVESARTALFATETATIAWFIFDYALRLATSRNRSRWAMRPVNIVDLVTIMPYFVDLAVGSNVKVLSASRIVRLTRMLRVLKMSRHSGGLNDVIIAVSNSSAALSLLSFLLFIALILLSTGMFAAEQTGSTFDVHRRLWIRDDGSVSPFQSIFHTMWWCMVTMTTVGYGDDVPVTLAGKLLGSVAMLSGVLVISFPTVILASAFYQAYTQRMTLLTLESIATLGKDREGNDRQVAAGRVGRVAARKHVNLHKKRPKFGSVCGDGDGDGEPEVEPTHVVFFDGHRECNAALPAATVPLMCEFAWGTPIAALGDAGMPYDDAFAVFEHTSQLDLDVKSDDGGAAVAASPAPSRPAAAGDATPELPLREDAADAPLRAATADGDLVSERTPELKPARQHSESFESPPSQEATTPTMPVIVTNLAPEESVVFEAAAAGALPAVATGAEQRAALGRAASRSLNHIAHHEDVVVNKVLFYAPLFQLECVKGTSIIEAAVTRLFPTGFSLKMEMLLDCEELRDAYRKQFVQRDVRRCRPSAVASTGGGDGGGDVSPERRRKQMVSGVTVKRIKTVAFALRFGAAGGKKPSRGSRALLDTCYLSVTRYVDPPASALPLTVVAPTADAFQCLVEHLAHVTFGITVDYAPPAEQALTMGHLAASTVLRKQRMPHFMLAGAGRNSNPLA